MKISDSLWQYVCLGAAALALLAMSLRGEAAAPIQGPPKQLRVAIVDTGLDLGDPRFAGRLCPDGSDYFTGHSILDLHGHGTHVAGLIQQYAGDANYCLMIEKYYADGNQGSINLRNEVLAIKNAIAHGAEIINISGGGPEFQEDEYLVIKGAPNVTFVVAAGNDHENFHKRYYPAAYELPNMVIVGAHDKSGRRLYSSNFGRGVVWEDGENQLSTLPNGKTGLMTGSSQATAIRTGKIVRSRSAGQ